MRAWPNFFIAGAPKAGTSSLYAYVRDVPGIHMSRIKEPNYFSRVIVPDHHPVGPIRDEAKYLALFSEATTETVVGEASPTYLADPEAPSRIKAVSPDARILVSLRDPIERAYSHYLMLRNVGRVRGGFLEEIERGLERGEDRSEVVLRPEIGLYHGQLRRYIDVFGEGRVKVLIYEELAADPKGALGEVLDFLGVEHSLDGFRPGEHRRYGEPRSPLTQLVFRNRMVARLAEVLLSPAVRKAVREKLLVKPAKKPEMDPEARAFLKKYYAEDVQGVLRLLERPLPWRNFATTEP